VRLPTPIFAAHRGSHISVDHQDEVMTVSAHFDTMPADARALFVRTCREIAAENDVKLRLRSGVVI
jgi:hypothetical protein